MFLSIYLYAYIDCEAVATKYTKRNKHMTYHNNHNTQYNTDIQGELKCITNNTEIIFVHIHIHKYIYNNEVFGVVSTESGE